MLTDDRLNLSIVAGAITSPVWLQSLGETATFVLPVAGVLWIALQMAWRIKNWSAKKK
jgi:hypothetical protein